MKDRGRNPRALDVAAFSRDGGELSGSWPLAGMTRLAAGFSAASDASAAWTARGSAVAKAGAEAQTWLELEASAVVTLQCQRCLQTVLMPLALRRRFRFVRDEDEAARLDEESDDDVLVLSPRLDLHELLEDELILALPIVPRHEVCPDPLPLAGSDGAEAEEPAPHPFAALAGLRGRAPGHGGS